MEEVASTAALANTGLIRAIGVRALGANVVNNIIGSGIFVLPALVAATLGPAAIVAYIVCAAAAGLIGLSFAAAGSRVSAPGGTYAYAEAAFGPFVGFLTGVLFWFGSQMISAAAIATVLASSLALLFPALGSATPRAAFLIFLYTGLAAVNVRGVQTGARLMEVLTLAKILPLVLLVVVGAFYVHPVNYAWTSTPTLTQLSSACLVLIFLFTGVEGAMTSSGEVKNPSRTVPLAILVGLGSVSALFIAVHLVAQGVLGPSLSLDQETPLATVAATIFGPAGKVLMAVAAAVSALGFVSGDMLATPRILFAFGRDGYLPARVGSVNPVTHTPVVAIVLEAVVTCGFAISGSFRSLVVLSTVSTLFIYIVTCLAAIQLKRKNVTAGGPPFQLRGGPVVPLLACVVIVWMLSGATRKEFISVGATLAAALVLYLVRAYYRPTSALVS
ncbi:MAG: APC family permease [Gemmatimonadota bacterium]|nr:APC family permease [Gemmatimonadota bacterium]